MGSTVPFMASASMKVISGTAEIPVDYKSLEEPAWVECGRWLRTQEVLFQKQKLSQNRYRLMKEVLGKLKRALHHIFVTLCRGLACFSLVFRCYRRKILA